MPSHLESCIGFLQETCDTNAAYFSFTTDASGEHGVIKANKDGLRLYAIELLKKSMEMEQTPAAENLLFFDDYDWLSEDAGYHLICGVAPTASSRAEILNQHQVERRIDAPGQKSSNRFSDWIPSLIILSGGLIVATIAALKWFH